VKARRNFGRYAAAAAVAVVAGFAVNGITAANTVAASYVGDGTGTVSGYDVTNVAWTLNGTNPYNVDEVAFDTDAVADTLKVKLVSGGATWYTCASGDGLAWTCDTTAGSQATAATIDELRVVAKADS